MDWKKRKFPLKMQVDDIEEALKERKFLVISFFGKTAYSARANKGLYIDECTGGSDYSSSEGSDRSEIEMTVDKDRDVVFLHMRSCMDAFTMAEKCKRFEEGLLSKGLLSFWSSKRYEYAKALLFLFQVSHILVCVQPGHTVDISYVHLFKSLDNLRNKLQGAVAKQIRDIPGLNRDWIKQGRLCSPRVLFLFLSAPISLRGTRGFRDDRKDTKPNKNPPIKRLEFSLEDQIYRIFRKSRIITNIAANSLFALPSNSEFVYVETGESGCKMDPCTAMMNTCYSFINGESRDQFMFSGPFYSQLEVEENRSRRGFANFLNQHIDQAFQKGFYDNVSKYSSGGVPSLWEIPTLSHWIQVADCLFNFFTETLTSAEGFDNSHAMCDLRDDLEIETIFSELRCKKILPQAVSVYEEGLPPFFNTEYHNAKLLQALSVFSMQARGPAAERFGEKLAAECTDIWRNGRMRCEEISLTGNLCSNRKHVLPGQEPLQEEKFGERLIKKLVPCLPHSSGVQYIAACSCGRKQANREDPYTLYDANYGFFAELEEDCCKDLEHIPFPVFSSHISSEFLETAHMVDDTKHAADLHQRDEISSQDKENSDVMETAQLLKAFKLGQSKFELDQKEDKLVEVEEQEKVHEKELGDVKQLPIEDAPTSNFTDNKSSALDSEIKDSKNEAASGVTVDVSGVGTQSPGDVSVKVVDDVEDVADEGLEGSEPGLTNPALSSLMEGEISSRSSSTPTIQDETDFILEVLENIHIDGAQTNQTAKVESLLSRSSTQFLIHMKTLASNPGLKPEFSSWSLILMGSSHSYSHSAGLGAMPGFMSSSKFLLPWEVPLTKATEEELASKWSHVLEYAARRATLLNDEQKEKITVKVFLGFEYECPRGHRFMVSAPDKPMKSSSTLREAAQRLVTSDMPLYMACPCRAKSPPVAQLMRIHIVTPKAPVYVTLFPQVQPVAGGPVFVSGWDTPTRLSIGSYWVLRLPYVYWGEGGAHLPPLIPPPRDQPYGVLIKGCISVDENFTDS